MMNRPGSPSIACGWIRMGEGLEPAGPCVTAGRFPARRTPRPRPGGARREPVRQASGPVDAEPFALSRSRAAAARAGPTIPRASATLWPI